MESERTSKSMWYKFTLLIDPKTGLLPGPLNGTFWTEFYACLRNAKEISQIQLFKAVGQEVRENQKTGHHEIALSYYLRLDLGEKCLEPLLRHFENEEIESKPDDNLDPIYPYLFIQKRVEGLVQEVVETLGLSHRVPGSLVDLIFPASDDDTAEIGWYEIWVGEKRGRVRLVFGEVKEFSRGRKPDTLRAKILSELTRVPRATH